MFQFHQCFGRQDILYGRENRGTQSSNNFRKPTNNGAQNDVTNKKPNFEPFDDLDDMDYFEDLDEFDDDVNDDTQIPPSKNANKTNNRVSVGDPGYEKFGKLAKSPSFRAMLDDAANGKMPDQYRHWTREFLQQTSRALGEAETSLSETRQFFHLMLRLPDLMNEIDETTSDIREDRDLIRDEEEFEDEFLDAYDINDFEDLGDPFHIDNFGFNIEEDDPKKIIFDENETKLIDEFEKLAKSQSVSGIITEISSAVMRMPNTIRDKILNFLNFTKDEFKKFDSPLAYLPEFYSLLLMNPQVTGKMYEMLTTSTFAKDANIGDITVDNFFAPLRQYIIDDGTKLPSNVTNPINQGSPARMFQNLATAPSLAGTVRNAVPSSVNPSNVNINAMINGTDTSPSGNGGVTVTKDEADKTSLKGKLAGLLKMGGNSTDSTTKPSIASQIASSLKLSKDDKTAVQQSKLPGIPNIPLIRVPAPVTVAA